MTKYEIIFLTITIIGFLINFIWSLIGEKHRKEQDARIKDLENKKEKREDDWHEEIKKNSDRLFELESMLITHIGIIASAFSSFASNAKYEKEISMLKEELSESIKKLNAQEKIIVQQQKTFGIKENEITKTKKRWKLCIFIKKKK